MAVVSRGGNTHAQGHDKGHGHGAGGDAAGVKRHREEALGHKGDQKENDGIEPHQHVGQGDAEQHSQKGHHQEKAHPRRHAEDEGPVGDGGDLLGQHLEIGLGDGDDEPQDEAQKHHQPQPPAPGHGRAGPLPHGGHADLGPQGEEHDPHHDHGGSEEEAQKHAGGKRRRGKAQDQDDADDGHHRGQSLAQLFPQLGECRSDGQKHSSFLMFPHLAILYHINQPRRNGVFRKNGELFRDAPGRSVKSG